MQTYIFSYNILCIMVWQNSLENYGDYCTWPPHYPHKSSAIVPVIFLWTCDNYSNRTSVPFSYI